MSAKILDVTTSIIENKPSGYLFDYSYSTISFDGFSRVYEVEDKDEDEANVSPLHLELTEKINVLGLKWDTKETQPPSRFTEASLVKELERVGIGRPSTYANTVEILKDRSYIEIESKHIVPTANGVSLNKFLQDNFSDIINTTFTAEVESKLDKIASGESNRIDVLREFYVPFDALVNKVRSDAESTKPKAELTNEICPNCGKPLVIRTSFKGSRFYACSGFPKCKHTAPLFEVNKNEPQVICPDCGGTIVKKQVKSGPKIGTFLYGCNNYPTCKKILTEKEYKALLGNVSGDDNTNKGD
jgi:DNA topoisomerase-1